jgi:hypothetical protein
MSSPTHRFVCWCYHQPTTLSNERLSSLALQGTHVCSTFLYHSPTTNCWWVEKYREAASTHKSLGGPQCPEFFRPPPNAHTPSQRISLPKLNHKGVGMSAKPLVHFGRNSGRRHRRSLFRPPSRQRAKSMLFLQSSTCAVALEGHNAQNFFPASYSLPVV